MSSKIGLSNGLALWNKCVISHDDYYYKTTPICCLMYTLKTSLQLRVLFHDIKVKYEILSNIAIIGTIILGTMLLLCLFQHCEMPVENSCFHLVLVNTHHIHLI